MIPEFDGTLRNKLQDFLTFSYTYVMNNINLANKELLQAILYTKFTDRIFRRWGRDKKFLYFLIIIIIIKQKNTFLLFQVCIKIP